MHGTAPSGGPAGMGEHYDLAQATRLIHDAKVNTFITRLSGNANDLAAENNKLQEIAEGERLGIPVTLISTDPRRAINFVLRRERVWRRGISLNGRDRWDWRLFAMRR